MHSHSAETQTITTLGNLHRGLWAHQSNRVVPISNRACPCGLKSHCHRETMPRTGGLKRSAKCKTELYLPTLSCLAAGASTFMSGRRALTAREIDGCSKSNTVGPTVSKDETDKEMGGEASHWIEEKGLFGCGLVLQRSRSARTSALWVPAKGCLRPGEPKGVGRHEE